MAEKSAGKATKSAGKSGAKRAPNPALMKPLQPSGELGAIVGSSPLPRPEVVKKVWDYIKKNKLQKVFGKKKVTMFEMNKHLAQHLK